MSAAGPDSVSPQWPGVLRIDPASGTPPYEQLRSQLIAQISTGALSPGQRLPPVRRLASDLGLAANTVARTYRELEVGGHVRTQGRNGTVVADPSLDAGEAHQQALALADHYISGMRALGVAPERMITYLQRGLTS